MQYQSWVLYHEARYLFGLSRYTSNLVMNMKLSNKQGALKVVMHESSIILKQRSYQHSSCNA